MKALPGKVAGATVILQLPTRPSVRLGIATLARQREIVANQQTAQLLVAAALLLCWPDALVRDGAPRYHHQVLEYGSEAIDFLVGVALDGAPAEDPATVMNRTVRELIAAGNIALTMITDSMVTQEDLEKARKNSLPERAPGSASSSGSSDSTRADQPAG